VSHIEMFDNFAGEHLFRYRRGCRWWRTS
jgi:hypothetical protein